ncbi:MAG TPA: YfhO family protein, partial [Candidatus Dormibacteraeota bacterium]|nr:YfhO family protein [Candidatus Dormibacteraeota bacterium]
PEVVLVWLLIICAPLAARWRQNFGALLVVGASALDLVPWSQHLLPHGEPELFYPANPLIGTLTRETEGGAWRSIGLYKLIYPSLLPVYGLAELRPNNVLAPSDQLDVLRLAFGFNPTALNYYAAVANVDHPLLSFLNVRAVVGHIYLPQPRTLVPILEPRTLPFLVFRNVHALPRWFVPAAVDLIEPEDLPRWIAELDNAGRVAVFREQMEGFTLPPAAGVVSTARLLVGTSGHVELEVPGRGSRLLATSLPLPAGWQAAGGGRKLSTVTVNGAFLGALCPDGVSRITLDFLPPGIETGVVLFALALGVLSTLYWKATGH